MRSFIMWLLWVAAPIIVLFALVASLSGCASAEKVASSDPDCAIPVTETSDLGTQTLGCAYWSFGPSKGQDVRFRYRMFEYFHR